MFSKKESKIVMSKTTERNFFGKETTIIGDIISKGDFRIEGTVEGTLKTDGRVVVGEKGVITGKVECENADIAGSFSGELKVNQTLTLKSTAIITGDVITSKLAIEPGATFNATCSMKGTVKELKKNDKKTNQKQQTA